MDSAENYLSTDMENKADNVREIQKLTDEQLNSYEENVNVGNVGVLEEISDRISGLMTSQKYELEILVNSFTYFEKYTTAAQQFLKDTYKDKKYENMAPDDVLKALEKFSDERYMPIIDQFKSHSKELERLTKLAKKKIPDAPKEILLTKDDVEETLSAIESLLSEEESYEPTPLPEDAEGAYQ